MLREMVIKIEIEVIKNTKISKDNYFNTISNRHHHSKNTISIKNYLVTITPTPTIFIIKTKIMMIMSNTSNNL